MIRNIVVDIDNTLWDFATVLLDSLKEVNPEIPNMTSWTEWDWWEPYLSKGAFYRAINDIHMKQDQFLPYGEAKHFLSSLQNRDFHITIASHRDVTSKEVTEKWLFENDLPFHNLHLSYDKSVLFDNCDLIIDDSPEILKKAKDAGVARTGLAHPWNSREEHPLFDDLIEVLNYVETHV